MWTDLLGLVVRISVMYGYALALLRLSGKRSIGDLSSLDFIVTLIIGDMFDDIFWAEIPLSQVAVGMAAIVLLHMAVAAVSYASPRVERLVSGGRTPIVRSGRLVQAGMRSQRLPREEVYADLRMQGEEMLKDIRAADLEPSGHLSVLKKDEARPVQKQDRDRLQELYP